MVKSVRMAHDPKDDPVYQLLLRIRGEEYADLYLASDEERMRYITWWQSNFDTENDKIKDLGLEPEHFPSLYEAKKFLAEMETYEQDREQEKKKLCEAAAPLKTPEKK
jgi:hypothetical protein